MDETGSATVLSQRGSDVGRGERTRSAILDASRQLFLERGYAGTPVNAITVACGISRAGFYTYFKDKHEVFDLLGETAYRDLMDVIAELDSMPAAPTLGSLRAWVTRYFDYMDVHGAFVLASAHSAPDDEDFRRSRDRLQTRAAWALGTQLEKRRRGPLESPEVVGTVTMSLLDRSWHSNRSQSVATSRLEVIRAVAQMISGIVEIDGE